MLLEHTRPTELLKIDLPHERQGSTAVVAYWPSNLDRNIGRTTKKVRLSTSMYGSFMGVQQPSQKSDALDNRAKWLKVRMKSWYCKMPMGGRSAYHSFFSLPTNSRAIIILWIW